MNKNKVIVFTTITVILATAAVSAFAASSRNKTVTCPNCGTSVELPVPEREGKGGPGKAMNGNRGGGRQAVPNADVADNAGQEQ